MWLPKWLVPILAIALTTASGSRLFARDAATPGVEPVPFDAAATRTPIRFPEQIPKQGIFLQAPGTWLDPPPDAVGVPAQIPMPPRYPPYGEAEERYRDVQRSMYLRQTDPDRRRSASWLDSICPMPKRRRAWSPQDGYPRQIEQLDPWAYPDPFMSGPPSGLIGPDGR